MANKIAGTTRGATEQRERRKDKVYTMKRLLMDRAQARELNAKRKHIKKRRFSRKVD
jgi:hypothetical protein